MVKRGALNSRIDALYYKSSKSLDLVTKSIYPQKKLSEIAELKRGRFSHRPRNAPEFYGGKYPFIQTGDIVKASNEGGDIIFTQTLNELGLSVSKLFEPNILVMTIAANIGDTAILTYPACFPDSLVTIKPKTEVIDVYYLNIFFTFLKEYLNEIAPQTAQKNINLQQLSPVPIVVPPLEIQSEIVAIFNQAYAEKRQKETKAKELLASIDAYLLEQLEIVLPDKIEEKNVFYVPSSKVQGNRFDPFYHKNEFEILDIAISNGKYDNQKLGIFLSQINYGASVKSEYVADGIPFLRISDLQRNEISITEMKYLPKSMQKDIGNAFVYKDDFLISRSGTIGIVARVSKEFDGFAYGSFMIKFTLFENAPMDKDYLSYFLNCETMERIIRRNKIGAVQGNITIPTIRNLQIPLPPLEIQTEIANHIRNIRERAKTLETEAKEVIEKAKAEVEKMILGE